MLGEDVTMGGTATGTVTMVAGASGTIGEPGAASGVLAVVGGAAVPLSGIERSHRAGSGGAAGLVEVWQQQGHSSRTAVVAAMAHEDVSYYRGQYKDRLLPLLR